MKTAYNDYDLNIIPITNSPFAHIKVPKQEVTRKRALSVDHITKILEFPYQKDSDGNNLLSSVNIAKDCFLLSFCLMGMNSIDLYNANIYDGESIIYFRTKTRARRQDKAEMHVSIHHTIKSLIHKYKDRTNKRVFNFYTRYSSPANFNKAINKGLKHIGQKLGIYDLEYYAARHSWATIALNKVKIDKYTVHSCLNHLDESMKVTDIYLERDFTIENEANYKVLEYVFHM